MRSRFLFLVSLLFLLSGYAAAQVDQGSSAPAIIRVDPPDWWVGMKDNKLQLCVYGKGIAAYTVTTSYPGLIIAKVNKVSNPDYLFVDITIAAATRAGDPILRFTSGSRTFSHPYRLMARSSHKGQMQGVDSRDLVYLIMPDRFADGDTANDIWPGANEKTLVRDSMFYRHGGDIKGVVDHLSYIKDLGVTTIWMTPVQENNQPKESYHGYAITDHYRVDPRFGDNAQYVNYVARAHAQGLKVMQDMVYNHVGSEHWFIRDLPSSDWVHQFDTFTKTNYRATALIDPYASDFDRHKMSNGWFAPHMPDLNQQNPYLATYLIQNSIWWIETTGIDGYRIDTYTYSDLAFMQHLMHRIQREYPHFTAVGELWDHCVAIEAYFMQHPRIAGALDTHLTGLIDFQLYNAINEALSKPMGWTEGLSRIYYTLMQDVLYSDPSHNLTFLDNHDLSRFYSMIGEDIRKYKMGIAFLLTTRGTPSIYYGTEMLMKNYADPDGKVRSDFPGGWQHDTVSKFTAACRSAKENEAFDFVRTLAHYRQANDVLQTGKLTQFVPESDTYVYFRSNERKTVMIIMHYSDKTGILKLSRFAEKMTGYKSSRDIITGTTLPLQPEMALQPYDVRVLELVR